MRSCFRPLAFTAAALVATVATVTFAGDPRQIGAARKVETSKKLYTCPMHPQIRWTRADSCPICDMKLVPVKTATPNSNEQRAQPDQPQLDHNAMTMPGHNHMQMDHSGMDQGMGGCGMCMEMMGKGNMNHSATPAIQKAAPPRGYYSRGAGYGRGCGY